MTKTVHDHYIETAASIEDALQNLARELKAHRERHEADPTNQQMFDELHATWARLADATEVLWSARKARS